MGNSQQDEESGGDGEFHGCGGRGDLRQKTEESVAVSGHFSPSVLRPREEQNRPGLTFP